MTSKQNERKTSFGLKVSIAALLILVAACGLSSDQPGASFFELFLAENDFPNGWEKDRVGIGPDEGVISRIRSFRHRSAGEMPFVNVEQIVIMYETADQAEQAFSDWISTEFPTESWQSPPDLLVESASDQIQVSCMEPISINGYMSRVCIAVMRAGNYISILNGKVFEEQWLIMQDYGNLIDAMEFRFSSVVQKNQGN